MGGDLWSGRRGSNSLLGIPRMAVAIRRSPAGPLNLTRFAQVEATSSPVLRHIPKRKHHPDGWCFFVIVHRFCCLHSRPPQGRGSVRGKPLRVSPLAFNHPPAGDHFCAAKVPLQKRRDTHSCVSSFLERATRLELATSTLARSRSTR